MKTFSTGEVVDIVDNSSPRIFRKAVIVKEECKAEIYKVSLLDSDLTLTLPINKIRKIYDS